jgi:hypothetical protein
MTNEVAAVNLPAELDAINAVRAALRQYERPHGTGAVLWAMKRAEADRARIAVGALLRAGWQPPSSPPSPSSEGSSDE